MRSVQKYNMFKKKFGVLLSECGFVYKGGKFLCVRPGGVLLSTGIELLSMGQGRILFEAIPFCCGITHPLKQACMHLPPLSRGYKERKKAAEEVFHEVQKGRMAYKEFLETMFLMDINAQFETYRDTIYEKFVKIENVRDALDFHEWMHRIHGYLAYPNILEMECIYLGEYEKAAGYARFLLERYEMGYKKRLQEMENHIAAGEVADCTGAYQNAYFKEAPDKIRLLRMDIEDIMHGHYERFEKIINENLEISRQTCEMLFPDRSFTMQKAANIKK